jgi:cell division septal protein FtsQ
VLLIGATVLLVCFFAHPAFRVRAVSVSGQRLAEPGQIVAASGVEGRSVFHLDPGRSASRIPTVCLSIEYALVESSLPSSVRIEVKERRIATVWRTRGESYLVDESGLILVRGAIVGRSVLIDDHDNVERQPGDHVPMEVLSLVWSLNRIEPALDTFQYSELRGVAVVTPQGYPVYFGTRGDAAFKLGLLQALVSDFQARGIHPQYVDLRLDRRPAYR